MKFKDLRRSGSNFTFGNKRSLLVAGFLVVAVVSTGVFLGTRKPSETNSSADTGRTWVVCPSYNTECDFPRVDDNLGSDNGKAIQLAIDVANNGDTILIKSGNYTRQTFTEFVYQRDNQTKKRKAFFTNETNGVAKDITIQGENGTVIDGANSVNISGAYAKTGNLTIIGIELKGFKEDSGDCASEDQQSLPCSSGNGVAIYGTSNATIENNTINNAKWGVSLRDQSVGNIKNNILHDTSNSAIYLAETANATIENNTINNAKWGVSLRDQSVGNIKNNIMHDLSGDAIYLAETANATIENNTIYKVTIAGLNIYSCSTNNPSVVAKNNIIYDIAKNYDNTFGWGIGGGCLHDQGKLANDHIGYNLVFAEAGGNTNDCEGMHLCTWEGKVEGNPLFVNLNTYDYHLQVGSPAINTGDPADSFNDPDGSRSDMGAYGGPDACNLDHNLPGCNQPSPSATPSDSPTPTLSGSPTATPSGSPTPTNPPVCVADSPCTGLSAGQCKFDTQSIFSGYLESITTPDGKFWNYNRNNNTWLHYDLRTLLGQVRYTQPNGPCVGMSDPAACIFDTRTFYTGGGLNYESITTSTNKYYNYDLNTNTWFSPGDLISVPRYVAVNGPCYNHGSSCRFDTRTFYTGGGNNWESITTPDGKYWNYDLTNNSWVVSYSGLDLTSVSKYTINGGPCQQGVPCRFATRMFDGNYEIITTPDGKYWKYNMSSNLWDVSGKDLTDSTLHYAQACVPVTDTPTPTVTGPGALQKPTILPEDQSYFATDTLDITIKTNDSTVDKLSYDINNNDTIECTQGSRPLSCTFQIGSTSDIDAFAHRGNEVSSSESSTFTKVAMSAPTNLSFSCNESGAGATMNWNSVQGALSYIVRVNKDGEFNPSDPVTGDMFYFTTTNSVAITNITASANYQYWSVQPLLVRNNDPEHYADTASFEVKQNNFFCNPSNANIPIINAYSTITNRSTVEISGTKVLGDSLWVSGQQYVTGGLATTWLVALQLGQAGINNFEVYTVNSSGAESAHAPVQIKRCEPGDVDCDGQVNISDLGLFIQAVKIQYDIDRGVPRDKYLINTLSDMNYDNRNDTVGDFTAFAQAYITHNR